MNQEDLKMQLVRETQAKNQSVESAKLALTNAVETLRKDFNESASNLRSDTRTEVQKTREALESEAKRTREAFEKMIEEERQRLAAFRRKTWIMAAVLVPVVILLTVAGTLSLAWFTVSKGTTQALGTMQQSAVQDLAETRTQLTQAKIESAALGIQIEDEKKRLAEEKARSDRLTTWLSKEGTIFVAVPPDAKTQEFQGYTVIPAITKPPTP
jgi:predicted anti-sigma-YlaC factor YlaD